MRLIDADAAVDLIRRMAENYRKIGQSEYANRLEGDANVMASKEICPTIDAAPVVHAQWEYIEDYAYSRIGWHCTSCRKRIPNEMVAFAKYCPSCGAKMDGGADG